MFLYSRMLAPPVPQYLPNCPQMRECLMRNTSRMSPAVLASNGNWGTCHHVDISSYPRIVMSPCHIISYHGTIEPWNHGTIKLPCHDITTISFPFLFSGFTFCRIFYHRRWKAGETIKCECFCPVGSFFLPPIFTLYIYLFFSLYIEGGGRGQQENNERWKFCELWQNFRGYFIHYSLISALSEILLWEIHCLSCNLLLSDHPHQRNQISVTKVLTLLL